MPERPDLEYMVPLLQKELKGRTITGVKVRNKAGQLCPSYGTKLRRAGVRGVDSHFCPSCQPERRKTGIVDWRKLKR